MDREEQKEVARQRKNKRYVKGLLKREINLEAIKKHGTLVENKG